MRENSNNIINEGYQLLDNPSKIYINDSVWATKKYGNIKIVGFIGRKPGKLLFVVEFEDGTQIIADHGNIKNGNVKNPYYYGSVCGVGCLGAASSKHFLYGHWQQMLHRCYDKTHHRYKDYGGRGIKVCDKWLCFEYFLEDITHLDGYEKLYDGRHYQLDRINNNKDYEPSNCRIVSASKNSRNKRTNNIVKVIINDKVDTMGCIADVSQKYDIPYWKAKRIAKNGECYNGVMLVSLNDMERKRYEENMG